MTRLVEAGEGVMPCCGATPFEHRNDRMTKEARLVNCDRMRLLTRVGELKSENLLLTKERDAARAQADEMLALRAKEGWMP